MKVKNIAFSGFMAAIMLSAGGANAAAVNIASQAYVDQQDKTVSESVTAISNTLTNEYTKTEQLGTIINENITNAITAEDSELKKELDSKADSSVVDTLSTDVGALKTTVGDETAGLVKDVADAAAAAAGAATAAGNAQNAADAAQAAADTAQSGVDGLTTRVTANETNIGNLQTKVGTAELSTSAKNIAEAINELKTKTDGMATEGNFEEMNNKITEMETTVAGKADKADTLAGYGITDAYTKTETTTQIQTYALPKPAANCATGMCVLSVGSDGTTLTWVDVTQPYTTE